MTSMLTPSLPFGRLALVVSSLALAGCASSLEGLVSTHQSEAFLTTGSVIEVQQTTALASLPREAGRVLGVREQRRDDGLQQHITLSGDPLASGENWIKIDVAARRALTAPSHAQLHGEMVSVFGGRALPVHNYVLSNDHGPVGLAFGQIDGQGACAYIWQEVSQSDVQLSEQLAFARAAGVWSVRARLCRERLTADHAVAFAQGLSLGAFSDPLFAPLANAPAAPIAAAPTTLASLDAPARSTQPRRQSVARAVPSPIAPPQRAAAPVQTSSSQPIAGAVAIALPDTPVTAPTASETTRAQTASTSPERSSAPLPAPTSAETPAPTQQSALVVPLPGQ